MQYETEEQQVEAIKAWWKENGVSAIAGVVIGLLAVFGWRAWISHRDMVAAEASDIFEQLVTAVEAGKKDNFSQHANTLRTEYAFTPYAGFAELMVARGYYEKGDIVEAKNALQQAIVKAPFPAIAAIATLRLARIQLAAKELAAAKATLQQHQATPTFTAEYAALQGDIAHAEGDMAAARSFYEKALAGKVGQADLIRLKLDNLPQPQKAVPASTVTADLKQPPVTVKPQ